MFKWNLREIVVMSALAVVFAIVYLLFFQVGSVMVGLMGPIGYEPIFGIWFIVSIITAYIIRKPGAAFLSETIAAFVEVLIGNVNGPRLITIRYDPGTRGRSCLCCHWLETVFSLGFNGCRNGLIRF